MNLLKKIILYAYPTSDRALTALEEKYKWKLEENDLNWKRDILTAIGFSIWHSSKKTKLEVIQIITALYENNNEIYSTAKRAGLEGEDLIEALLSLPAGEDKLNHFAELAKKAIEIKATYIAKRKQELEEKKEKLAAERTREDKKINDELDRLANDDIRARVEHAEVQANIDVHEEK